MSGMDLGLASAALNWLHLQAAALPSMVFFTEINDFLNDEIADFATNLLWRSGRLVVRGAALLTMFWIIFQGYRIVSGQSRESMMSLVMNSLRIVLIVGIALSASAGAGSTYRLLTDDMASVVRGTVTGRTDEGPYRDIDRTLAIMQVALEVVGSIDTGGDVTVNDAKQRALTLTGVGLGGPAMMAATAMLLNKIAMALIIGLGPIFILCLLFDQTKQLFSRWLFYGLATMFSMAFLTVMVTLAFDMLIAVGTAFWLPSTWTGPDAESLTSLAMQQAGLGVVLSTLILSAPPLAGMFFNGVMGHFQNYDASGRSQMLPSTQPGMPPHVPANSSVATPDDYPGDSRAFPPPVRLAGDQYTSGLRGNVA